MSPEHETFWTLLGDLAHWEFELFLMFLFDGVIGVLIWPRLKRWVSHHKSDDQKIERLEKQIAELQKTVDSIQEQSRNDLVLNIKRSG